MLCHSDYAISVISTTLAFSSQSYFTSVFREKPVNTNAVSCRTLPHCYSLCLMNLLLFYRISRIMAIGSLVIWRHYHNLCLATFFHPAGLSGKSNVVGNLFHCKLMLPNHISADCGVLSHDDSFLHSFLHLSALHFTSARFFFIIWCNTYFLFHIDNQWNLSVLLW